MKTQEAHWDLQAVAANQFRPDGDKSNHSPDQRVLTGSLIGSHIIQGINDDDDDDGHTTTT
jgi:hypothetical protein